MADLIEIFPHGVKSGYVTLIQALKTVLKKIGWLTILDNKSKHSPRYHYLRSLLAIHQLDDMIQLDVPWWTYSAISFIEQFIQTLPPTVTVFEYGSGASTLWLAKRLGQVISVEHDSTWYQQLKSKITDPNIELLLKQPSKANGTSIYRSVKMPHYNFAEYVDAIKAYPTQFDIIIIDGRCRNDCLRVALPYLKPEGIIIFDNSNRQRYQSALKQSKLCIKRFKGRVPGSPLPSETAILSHQEL